MTKTELMENYTAEQLAEMEKLYRDITQCREHSGEHLHSEEYLKILSLNRTISELQSEVEKYHKAFEDAKKEHECQVAEYRKKIDDLEHDLKTAGEKIQDLASVNMNLQCERNDYKSKAETLEIESGRIDTNKSELERAKNTINQIDDILERLFGVRHDIGKPDEFEKILSERVKGNAVDFLPTEPIKVADMLINAEGEYEHNPITKAFCGTDKDTYRIFEVSELRQIAEHLLVYCNHNGEAQE